jgi:hypothetical protein
MIVGGNRLLGSLDLSPRHSFRAEAPFDRQSMRILVPLPAHWEAKINLYRLSLLGRRALHALVPSPTACGVRKVCDVWRGREER